MTDRAWRDEAYERVFDEVCARIRRRRQVDPSFTLADAQGTLETAYVQQGNDWVGRGMLSHLVESATIAAWEHMIAEWQAEREE